VNIVNSYDLWKTDRIEQFNSRLKKGMLDMISWWNKFSNGNPVEVSSFLFPWP
jgi:hypothetical protein